jgi:hypothetical protein
VDIPVIIYGDASELNPSATDAAIRAIARAIGRSAFGPI